MCKQKTFLAIMLLGIAIAVLFYGKAKADSQRVQNPEDGYGYQGIDTPSKQNQKTATNGEISFLPFRVQEGCYDPGYHFQIATNDSYSGTVNITTSGIGQALHDAWQDAFYIFTDESEQPITPYYNDYMTLWINGEGTNHYIDPIPPYNPAHVYSFSIIAPGGPLIFAVGDPCPGDNSGSYLIRIDKGRNISLSAANTTISPDGQTKLTVSVTENGVPVANTKVEVEVQVTDGSGGHQHSDFYRPRGCLTYNGHKSLLTATKPWIEVTTDSAGKAIVIFKPGKDRSQGCQRRGIAGNYEVTARLTDSPSTYDRQIIIAKVDGLELLPGSNYYIKLRGGRTTHRDGQYATQYTIAKLNSLASEFYNQVGKKLSINDISLPRGGFFDLSNDFNYDPKIGHAEHGYGHAVDFNHFDSNGNPLERRDIATLRILGAQYGMWADREWPKSMHLDFGSPSEQFLRRLATGPDLSVVTYSFPDEFLVPAAGQVISFTVGFGNILGNAPANNTVLTVTLPSALTLVSADPLPSGGTNNQPIWEIGTIDAGGVPRIITLEAVVNSNVAPGTVFTTTSQISSDEPDINSADNLAEFSLTSYPLGADLDVWSDVEPSDITPGQTSAFTITIANYGNVDAPGTVLTLTVPSQIEVLSTSPMSTSYQANNIIWQLGNLPVNQELPVTVTLYTPPNIDVGSLLTYTLHSMSEAPDITMDDNFRQVVYQVKQTGVDAGVTLDVRGMHEDGNFSVGETITYTIYYGNYGNQIPDSYSQIVFRLGNGLVLLSAKPHDSSVITGTISEYGGTWYIPNLPIGSVDYIEVFAQVMSISDDGSAAYAVISQEQDIDTTNNTDYELRFEHMYKVYLPIVLR